MTYNESLHSISCPVCSKSYLNSMDLATQDEPLIGCASCDGIWLDREESARVLGEGASSRLAIPPYAMKTGKACPICQVTLYEYCYPATEIQIDGCKSCGGVWFDRNEIGDIKKAEYECTRVVCPRCNTENSYNINEFAVASCSSCGTLFKKLFDRSGTPLASSTENNFSSYRSNRTPLRGEALPSENISITCEWENVKDVESEYKFCLLAVPAMLFIAVLFNSSSLGGAIQRIWLTMPVHEFGHALTGWFTGYNAVPSLWVTSVSGSRGLVAPIALFAGIAFLFHYSRVHDNLWGKVLCAALLLVQFVGTCMISPSTATMLITFGGDGMGLILATLLMASFYYGKETNLYKGALRWGFVAIGAAAFVDIYSVWFSALTDIAKVPYGTSGGRFTDSYKLIEHHGWTFDELISRYFMLGNSCLVVLGVVYYLGLKKVKNIMRERGNSA